MKIFLRFIFCLVFFTLFYDLAIAQPINDACANAILITSGTSCNPTTGTTENATDDNIPGGCNINAQGVNANSVWYKFVATVNSETVRVQGLTVGAVMFDPVIAAFTSCGGATPSGGVCTDNTNDGGIEILQLTNLTIGSTYYIQVHDFYGRTSSQCQFNICVFHTPPPNDACANAIMLPSGTFCTPTNGTTENATDDNIPGECNIHAQGVNANSVWYSFVATSVIQTVRVQGLTSGAVMFDPVIAAFGSCGGASPSGGQCTDNTNDGATETLLLTGLIIGHTYLIQVHDFYGRNSADCQFTICVFNTPVANDICANAIPLPETIDCTPMAGSTENANNEQVTGECNIASNANSVWYSFVATVSSENIYVQGSPAFDAVVGVFAGCGGASPSGGGCTDDSGGGGLETLPLTGLTVGSTYYIEIYDYYGSTAADANFTICRVKLPPVNDACANAIMLSPGTYCTPTAGTTAGATDDHLPGQCTYATPNSVWYSFVATATAQNVRVAGATDFDAVLAAFASCGGTVLNGGSCTDNTNSGEVETLVLTGLTIGSTYTVQVYDYNGRNFGTSNFTICVFKPLILPLELKSFTGKIEGAINVLNWETLAEKNVQSHIVERSIDNTNWREIGRKNGLLNSTISTTYTLEDRTPLAKAYYRLRSVDVDGQESRSSSILLVRKAESFGIISVFPSPTKGDVTVQFNAVQKEIVTIQILDMTGRLVVSKTVEAMQDINEIPLILNGLQAGIYLVIMKNSNNISSLARFVRQ